MHLSGHTDFLVGVDHLLETNLLLPLEIGLVAHFGEVLLVVALGSSTHICVLDDLA